MIYFENLGNITKHYISLPGGEAIGEPAKQFLIK